MGNCNSCSYSSVVQKDGIVKLYCILAGKSLDLVQENCGYSKDMKLRAMEHRMEKVEK